MVVPELPNKDMSLQEKWQNLISRLWLRDVEMWESADQNYGDLGGSGTKTGVRAGLSPQCLCGNNQVDFTSLIIMFAVFLFPILRTWLQNEAVPFLYKRLSCSFSLPNSSQLPEYFNARTLFLVVKGNSLICSDQHCVQHFYKVYFFIPILFPRLPLFFIST